ncbi:MAG: hypothetical protein IT381_17050 [Deltaproteobacteria bacterium]|nr:hypothetical protein [Deltaproteobacteria bacterium]
MAAVFGPYPMFPPLFVTIALGTVQTPLVELACLKTEGGRIDCARLAEKLAIYGGTYTVSVVAAENGETSEDAVFRVTLLERGAECLIETIALLDKAAAPRTATFVCDEAHEPERPLALHIKGELDGGFEETLRTLRGGARRLRQVESPLARKQREPGIREKSEKAAPLPTPEPEPAPAADAFASSLAAGETAASALRVGLTLGGALTGFSALVSGGFGLAIVGQFRVPVQIGVGVRLGFRPPLATASGALASTWIEPFVRAGYCFDPHTRVALCVSAAGEAVLALLRLSGSGTILVATGAAGADLRVSYALHPRVGIYLDGRVLAAFHRPEFVSGDVTLFALPPIVWGSEVGLALWF